MPDPDDPLAPLLDADPPPTADELVDRYVRLAVARCGGHKARAAALVGLSVKTVYSRLERAATRDEFRGPISDTEEEAR